MKPAKPDKPVEDARTWRPPTRRMFVALLGGAAAALAIRLPAAPQAAAPPATPRSGAGKTRWIGHC